MAHLTKNVDIELDSGRIIPVEIEVTGIFDSHYGADADGGKMQGRWLVDSHSYDIQSDDELTKEESEELEEAVEGLVYDTSWDFDSDDSYEYAEEEGLF